MLAYAPFRGLRALAAKDMTAMLIKLIGTAHGFFGLWTLLILPGVLKSGILQNLSAVQSSIKLTATFLGAAMLLLCAWFSWQLSDNSFAYAWLALGAFVLAASSDTIALYGFGGFARLMSTFYKTVGVRFVAALLLTALVLSLPDTTVGG